MSLEVTLLHVLFSLTLFNSWVLMFDRLVIGVWKFTICTLWKSKWHNTSRVKWNLLRPVYISWLTCEMVVHRVKEEDLAKIMKIFSSGFLFDLSVNHFLIILSPVKWRLQVIWIPEGYRNSRCEYLCTLTRLQDARAGTSEWFMFVKGLGIRHWASLSCA